MPWTTHLLVVANRTAESGELVSYLQSRAQSGPLRVTLVGLAPGGGLKPHHADGPIMIQVLHGAIEFASGGQQWRLVPGSIFTLAAGLTHSVESPEGAIFVLTVAATGAHVPDPGQL